MSHQSKRHEADRKENDLNECSRKDEIIALGNELWGINGWSYGITSQHIDFTSSFNEQYHVGVATFVKVQLPNGIYREEMGYCNHSGPNKGITIYKARKVAVTQALRETFRSFGGNVADRLDKLLSGDSTKIQPPGMNIENESRIINQASDRKVESRFSFQTADTMKKKSSSMDVDKESSIINETASWKADSRIDGYLTTANSSTASSKVRPAKVKLNIDNGSSVINEAPSRKSDSQMDGVRCVSSTKTAFHTSSPIRCAEKIAKQDDNVDVSSAKTRSLNITNVDMSQLFFTQLPVSEPKPLTDDEIKAERLKRQKQKQEEFRRKMNLK